LLSPADLAIAGVFALIFFGPDKLPGLARQIGKVTREVQSTGQAFIREIEQAGDETTAEREARRIREQGMQPEPDYAATIASRPAREDAPLYDPIAHDPAANGERHGDTQAAEMRTSRPPERDDLRD